jgi:hypothetical protein
VLAKALVDANKPVTLDPAVLGAIVDWLDEH